MLSECQTVWIQIRTDVLLVLIWIQNVCKGYQQTTKVATSMERARYCYQYVYGGRHIVCVGVKRSLNLLINPVSGAFVLSYNELHIYRNDNVHKNWLKTQTCSNSMIIFITECVILEHSTLKNVYKMAKHFIRVCTVCTNKNKSTQQKCIII